MKPAMYALGRLKTGAMNQPPDALQTRLVMDAGRFRPAAPVLPADGAAYTREEAVQEAERCLKCACDACIRYCDLMHYFKKFPRRIAEEVEEQHDGEGEHEFAADDGPLARRGVFAEYGEAGGGVADRVHDEKEGQGHFEGVLHGEGLEHGCVG